MVAIIYAARPADEDHAFGHTSVEDMAALAQSVFVLISAAVIGWAAVVRLLSEPPRPLAGRGARHGGDGGLDRADARAGAVAAPGGAAHRQPGGRRPTGCTTWATCCRISARSLSLWVSRALRASAQIDSVVALAAAVMLVARGAADRQGGLGRADGPARRPRADRRRSPRIARGWPGVHGLSRPQDPDRGQPGLRAISISNWTATRACARPMTIGAGLQPQDHRRPIRSAT